MLQPVKIAALAAAMFFAAAMPVRAFIKHYRDEFQHHIDHKRCLVPAYA